MSETGIAKLITRKIAPETRRILVAKMENVRCLLLIIKMPALKPSIVNARKGRAITINTGSMMAAAISPAIPEKPIKHDGIIARIPAAKGNPVRFCTSLKGFAQ